MLTFEQLGLIVLGAVGLAVVSFCWGVATGEKKILASLQKRQYLKTADPRVSTEPASMKQRASVPQPQPPSSDRTIPVRAETQTIAAAVPGDATPAPGSPRIDAGMSQGVRDKKTVDKIYTIQVASFKRLQSARKEAEELRRRGFIKVKVLPKGNYRIVCVGEFRERAEAASFKKKLPSRYKDSLIRRL